MAAITEYESGRLLEFFKNHPDNDKKLISIAKTITKNTLTHLTLNGKKGHKYQQCRILKTCFRCLQNCTAALGIRVKHSQPKAYIEGDFTEILNRQQCSCNKQFYKSHVS